MAEADHRLPEDISLCGCFTAPHEFLITDTELGMDDDFATVSLMVCSVCGQRWLRYYYEIEAITASGRWYLGSITVEQASQISAGRAKSTLEGLSWYFFGGSFYGGKSGRTSGKIHLFP